MPREFAVSVTSPTSVEEVRQAFGNETYWHDRFVALGTSTTLTELTVAGGGTITVKTVQDLRHDGLPSLIATIYRRDLLVHSTEQWTPDGQGRVLGTIDIDVAGAPGSGCGHAVLQPSGEGSQLDFSGTVEFRVPLIGGRVESFISDQFTQLLPAIQRFTTNWIQGR